jgi:hypothetical protein
MALGGQRRIRSGDPWVGLWLSMALTILLAGCGAPVDQWQPFNTDTHGAFFGLGGQATPVLSLAADPQITGLVYVGMQGAGVRRTTADTIGVESVGPGMAAGSSVFALTPDPTIKATLYAGTSTGFYISTNAALSWQAHNAGLPADDVVTSIATGPNGAPLLAGTEKHGLFLSVNQGGGWRQIADGLPTEGRVNATLWVERSKTAFVAFEGGHLYTSHDDLQRWNTQDAGLPTGANILALAVSADQGTVYAGASQGLFASGDDGRSWTGVAGGLPAGSVGAVTAEPRPSGALYAAVENKVFVSTDAGKTWGAIAGALDKPARAIASATNRERTQVIYVTTGQLYRYPADAGGSPLAPILIVLLAVGVIAFLFIRSRRIRVRRAQPAPVNPVTEASPVVDTRSPAERYGDADKT